MNTSENKALAAIDDAQLDQVAGGLGTGIQPSFAFLPYAFAAALGIAGKPDASGTIPPGYFGWNNFLGFL